MSSPFEINLFDPVELEHVDDPVAAAVDRAMEINLFDFPRAEPISTIGYTEGLFKSFLFGAGPSLIGFDPSEDLARFQAQNPAASLTAEIAGSILPYAFIPFVGQGALGLKLASKLPGLSRLVQTAKSLEQTSPILSVALQEVARFAPLEITRAGLATGLTDAELIPEVAKSSFNLALLGGGAGLFKRISGSVPLPGPKFEGEAAIADKFVDYPRFGAVQERLGYLIDATKNAPAEAIGEADTVIISTIKQLQDDVLSQIPLDRAPAVTTIAGERGKDAASAFGSVFKTKGSRKGVLIERLIPKEETAEGVRFGTIKTVQEAEEALLGVGIGRDQLQHVIFPRRLTTQNATGRESLVGENGLVRFMQKIDQNSYIAKERNGMYVVLRRTGRRQRAFTPSQEEIIRQARLRGETINLRPKGTLAEAGDQYVLFKTNDPDLFFKRLSEPYVKLQSNYFRLEEGYKATESQFRYPLANYADRVIQAFPLSADIRGVPNDLRAEVIARALVRIHPILETTPENVTALTRRLLKTAKSNLSPGINKFSDHPAAQRIWITSQAIFNRSTAMSQEEFFGEAVFSQVANPLQLVFQTPARKGSLADLITEVYRGSRGGKLGEPAKQLNLAFKEMLSPEDAKAAGMDQSVLKLLRTLKRMDNKKIDEIIKTDLMTEGAESFQPLVNHYLVSRTWRGRWRMPVFRDDSGKAIIGYGSGHSRKEAIQNAELIAAEMKVQEPTTNAFVSKSRNVAFPSGRDNDLTIARDIIFDSNDARLFRQARSILVREPGRFQERAGAKGFIDDLSEKELKQIVYANLIESNRYNAGRLVQHKLGNEFLMVKKEMPETLWQDLNDLFTLQTGRRLDAATQQGVNRMLLGADEAIDDIISPMLGTSASELARQANRGMFSLTLGAFDLGFAALNAATPIQTVLPELSWLLSSAPERLAKYYTWNLVTGRSGAVRAINQLDPLKIMRETVRDLRSNDPQILGDVRRAIKELVIDKKFIEEFSGQAGKVALHPSAVFKGDVGIAEYLLTVSEYPAAKSEEFSRLFAFLAGRNVFKNFFGLEGEQLFQAASTFTNRTMFLYTSADRAKLITGGVGSFFGLFKNWSMHYLSNMMVYSGDAFLRRNMAPLLYLMGGTYTVGGLAALPGYGFAESFAEAATDQPLMQSLYEGLGMGNDIVGDRFADGVFYGLPGFAGISLQARAAVPGAAFIRDVNMMLTSTHLDRASHLTAAIGDAVDQWQITGQHPFTTQKSRNLFTRALAPRTLYRYMQFTEDRALKSFRTGNRLSGPQTAGERVLFSLGLSPTDFDKTFEISNLLWEQQARRRARVAELGEALAEAQITNNLETMNRIWGLVVLEGLEFDSVAQSAGIRVRNQLEPQIDRQFDELAKDRLRKAIQVR